MAFKEGVWYVSGVGKACEGVWHVRSGVACEQSGVACD